MLDTRELRAALRDVAPVLVPMLPFGALYGTLAMDGGFTAAEAIGMSAFVYAGASQLVALQLLAVESPLWAVVLSMFILNFRHVLYSASIGRHLGAFSPVQKTIGFFFLVDPSYAAAETRALRGRLTKTYYFGYALALYVVWQLSTAIGVVFGGLIEDPRVFALDFVLPVYFLAQTMAFQKRNGFFPVAGASFAASALVYMTLGAPWHVTLGGLAGLIVAAIRPLPGDPQ